MLVALKQRSATERTNAANSIDIHELSDDRKMMNNGAHVTNIYYRYLLYCLRHTH